MRASWWVVLASSVVLSSGCESRISLGARCGDEAACEAGLRCEFGRCRAQCVSANDCPSGAICIGTPGVCTLATDTCDAVCAEGLVCAGTVCAIPCDAVTDCRGGSICDGATDVCVSETIADAGTADAGMDAPAMEPPDAFEADAPAVDAFDLDAFSADAIAADAPSVDAPSIDAMVRGEPAHAMCVGYAHVCAIRGGQVYCWGAASSNQLGDSPMSTAIDHDALCGPWDCSDRPERPVLRTTGASTVPLRNVVALACGINNTCALVDDGSPSGGSVWCWGGTGEVLGHLGSGSHAGFVISEGATSIELGRDHGCARVDGGYLCWGVNATGDGEDGRLGSTGPSTSVARAAPVFVGASDLALGGQFTCRRGAEGVRCVGRNESEVTASGVRGPDPVGRPIAGMPSFIDDLTATSVSACVTGDGTAHCWGGELSRVLAPGDEPLPECFDGSPAFYCRPNARPIARGFDVRSEHLVSLSRGQANTICAITREQRVLCWGWNSHGQAGIDGAATGWDDIDRLSGFVSTSPGVPLEGAVSVGCGAASCCADTHAGVYCWGENDFGQLGNGTTDSRDVDAGITTSDTAALPHPYATPVDFSGIE